MIKINPATRRQVYELSEEELVAQPTWEFCSDEEDVDGQDEATVRPSVLDAKRIGPGEVIVAADVTFADGSNAVGYVYSGPAEDIGCIQPNVVAGGSQVNFWLGWLRFIKNPEERLAKAYERLAKAGDSVFPVTFETRVECEGVAKQVVVNGFVAKGAEVELVVLR